MNNPKRKPKAQTDKFGRRRTFGYPIDISGLENAGFGANPQFDDEIQGKHLFSNSLQQAMLKMCLENGTPLTDLVEKEEEEINKVIKAELETWLKEAMNRLPPNQEACVRLRFNLDNDTINKTIRTTQEVADLIGISQPTVFRNIKRGLANLKKDFKKNLEPRINRLKS